MDIHLLMQKSSIIDKSHARGLLLVGTQFLYVDGMFHLETLQYRRLVILLTSAELLDNTCLLEFSLELLECSFDVLTIFNWYDNHFLLYFFVIKLIFIFVSGSSHCLQAAKLLLISQ